jgi:hypothetical protein
MNKLKEYIRKVREIVRKLYSEVGEPPSGDILERMRSEISRIAFEMGIDGNIQKEAEKAIREETRKEAEQFVDSRFVPASSIQSLTSEVGKIREGYDRQVFEIVRRGIARNEDSKVIQERLARLGRTEERHYGTVQNTIRLGITRQGAIEQALANGVSYFRYSGASTGARPFCRERIGKVYSIEEIRAMDNGQGLPVEFFCGGYNCRHRWVAVAPGILKVEQGAKLTQDEQEAFEIITNYGHNVVARKPVGRKQEGKTYDAIIDGQKAELKTMTEKMADTNVSEAVRNKIREATKQGAEWILLYDKKGTDMKEIINGIYNFIRRSSKIFKTISIIKNKTIKTNNFKEVINERKIFE